MRTTLYRSITISLEVDFLTILWYPNCMNRQSVLTETSPNHPIASLPTEGLPFPNPSTTEMTVYQSAKLSGIATGMAIGEAAKAHVQLAEQAETAHYRETHDPLTGLHNRQGLNEAFDKMKAEPSKYPIGVVMIDLGRFKLINDSEGHGAGDEVLIDFSAQLKSGLRTNRTEDSQDSKSDKLGIIAARRSGDEFVVLARLGPSTDGATTAPSGQERRADDLTPEERLAGLEVHVQAIGETMRQQSQMLQKYRFSAVTGGAIVDSSLGEGLEKADQEMYKKKVTD